MLGWNSHLHNALHLAVLMVVVGLGGAIQAAAVAGQDDSDAQWLSSILRDSGAAANVRSGAARRMALSQDPVVIEALASAVVSADDSQLGAIASGIRDAERLPGPVVSAILMHACTHGALKPEHISMYRAAGDDVVETLQELAAEGEYTCRMIAIDALGALKHPVAAEALIQLLSVFDENAPGVEQIDQALTLFAEDGKRRTPDEWRAWWRGLSDQAASGQSLDSLEEQRNAAINRAERSEARAESLARRLAETLVRLLTVVPEDEREAKIIESSNDEEPSIRLVAVEQVERMLRNGRAPSDELKQAVVERLADADAMVRITTARLLDAMGYEDLGERLVEAITTETEPTVLVAMFEILGNRPVLAVLPEAIKNLQAASIDRADAAAGALIALGRVGLLDENACALVRESLAARSEGVNTSSLATVAVLATASPDSVAALLKSPLPAVRLGAATGLRVRGDRDALLKAASDPLLLPVAIAAWSDAPMMLASIDALLQLEPPAEAVDEYGAWIEAIGVVVDGLPPDVLIEADERLKTRPAFFENVRVALRRAAAMDELDPAQREAAARRLAARLIDREEPLEAAAELRAAGASATSPLGEMLFEALLLGKSWDEAALIRTDASSWLEVFDVQRIVRPTLAASLAVEIASRFGSEVSSERLTPATPVSTAIEDSQ